MQTAPSDYREGDSDERPWGSYTVTAIGKTDSGDDFCEKEITVNPGQKLSLQSHQFRREHWRVKEGILTVIRDDEQLILGPDAEIDIPQGAVHCMANTGDTVCIVYERQEGICREDDITRYADPYGRASEPEKAPNIVKKSLLLYNQILTDA